MKNRFRGANFLFLATLLASKSPVATAQSAAPQSCIIGIDHIPVAVRDLASAEETYRRMGFSLKPGRAHQDGIRNSHVKFPDGSGIELITASEPSDALAHTYVESLKKGDGPTDFSFHARDSVKLMAALAAAGYEFERGDGIVTLKDPQLRFVFFVQDNRSPTDRPEHFAHSNGAVAMLGIWLAPDDPSRLDALLLALGATAARRTVMTPSAAESTVYNVENGQIVVLPKEHQLLPGRAVVGAEFQTHDLAKTRECLDSAGVLRASAISGEHRLFVSPEWGRGIWLEFCDTSVHP